MDSTIAAIAAVLADGPPLRLAVLFGSRARGEARADSDVDLAIVPVDESLPLAAELDLAARLEAALGCAVDVLRLDGASTLTRFRVARDGVVLVAEPAHEWPRFQARAASEWGDFRPAFEAAAERFRRRLADETRR